MELTPSLNNSKKEKLKSFLLKVRDSLSNVVKLDYGTCWCGRPGSGPHGICDFHLFNKKSPNDSGLCVTKGTCPRCGNPTTSGGCDTCG